MLGLIVFVLAVLIDITCFVFARPETRANGRFSVVVAVSSVPMYLASALLFRKAKTMKEDDADEDESPGRR